MALPALKAGEIENIIHVGLVSHHLIKYAQECRLDKHIASFYFYRPQKKEDHRLGAAERIGASAESPQL
jgi:hypothetical protein